MPQAEGQDILHNIVLIKLHFEKKSRISNLTPNFQY